MKKEIPLCDLEQGQKGRITQIYLTGQIRRRILDIGMIKGTEVECVGMSLAGDPSAYRIRGAVIAIRSGDAKKIWVEVRSGKDS